MKHERLLFARTVLTSAVLFGLLWLTLRPEQVGAQGRELGRSTPPTGEGDRVDWVVNEGSGPGCYAVYMDANESYAGDQHPGFNMDFQSDGRTLAHVYVPLDGVENDHGWYRPCFENARGNRVEADAVIFYASLGETPGDPTTVFFPES